ncbi:hypothetical protein JXQ31_14030 [candidate division KSB1 bacterium]|nr:hypothetical protein [candidate division KSB1 bacterium]
MNFKFTIELVQTGTKASLYTVRLEGEKQSEFDKFLSDSDITTHAEFPALLERIDNIINKHGCQDTFFKLKESRLTDAVVALWRDNIRLYCCRYGNIILILGSGGLKYTRTYQQDPKLLKSIQIMSNVSEKIDEQINNKSIKIIENKFWGNLDFTNE